MTATSGRRPAALAAGSIFLAFLLVPSLCAGGVPPLDRTLRLDLWGVGMDEVRGGIESQTGVKVILYAPDFPDLTTDGIRLVTGRVTLRTVLECLSRTLSFRYRVNARGAVEISRTYDWVRDEPKLAFHRLDAIIPPEETGPDAMRLFLMELVKPLPLLPLAGPDGAVSIKVERKPAPDNPHSLQLVAALPPVLADYLDRGIRCLAGEAGDFPEPGEPRRQQLYARAAGTDAEWEGILARQIDVPRGGDLRAVLMDISEQAGIAVGVTPAAAASGPGLDELAGTRAGLGGFAGRLAAGFGLGRRVFLACGAICFEGGGDELELDRRSREWFWGGLAVAGFAASGAAERAGGGGALIAGIRNRVFPGLWRDPVCSLAFSRATGRLAVIAPRNAVEAVARHLSESVP